jgi:hypothetical protein
MTREVSLSVEKIGCFMDTIALLIKKVYRGLDLLLSDRPGRGNNTDCVTRFQPTRFDGHLFLL